MRELFLLVYAACVGLVAAGILTSFTQWVTEAPPRFVRPSGGALSYVGALAFAAVAGPIVVLRLASDHRQQNGTAVIAAGIGIATLWSCCLGLLLLEVILAALRSV
ncbi:MAG: hypothetical protein U1E56_04745 [Bauldia sp.]